MDASWAVVEMMDFLSASSSKVVHWQAGISKKFQSRGLVMVGKVL